MFIENIFRSLLFFFDQIIYGFIPTVYDFIIMLANTKLFTEGTIKTISNNIYAIIGFFMLFIIAFNLIKSVVNPDLLTNKDTGFGKIITRTIVAILLIVIIPVAFRYAWQIQQVIIDPQNSLITKAILGSGYEGAGTRLSGTALKAFITCDTTCSESQQENLNEALSDPKNLAKMSQTLNDIDPETGTYKYNYVALVSTATGVTILVMLITFCFDIALRLVKMGFLQVLSPVAIVSYVNPVKDGVFSKWAKMTISTYVGLFIRIAAVTFMALVLAQVPKIEFPADTTDTQRVFLIIFIVIGALIFAKNAPTMIKDLFGLKEEPLGGLNPFKRMLGGGLMQKGLGMGVKGARGLANRAVGLGAKGASSLAAGLRGARAAKKEGGNAGIGFRQGAKEGWKSQPLKGSLKDRAKGLSTGMKNAKEQATASATGQNPTSKYTQAQNIAREARTAGGMADRPAYTPRIEEALGNMNRAKENLDNLKGNLESSQRGLSGAEQTVSQNRVNLEGQRSAFSEASARYNSVSQTLGNARNQAKADVDRLQTLYNNASPDNIKVRADYKKELDAAQAKYTSIGSEISAAESSYNTARANLAAAEGTYNDSVADYKTTQRIVYQNQDSYTKAEKTYKTYETAFNSELEASPRIKADYNARKTADEKRKAANNLNNGGRP